MAWHSKVSNRKAVGDEAELEFQAVFGCRCGADFALSARSPGMPDFRCVRCGQFVDVKNCRDAEHYPTITLSQPAFDHYADDVLVIAKFGDKWMGRRAGYLRPDRGAVSPPSHNGRYATPFYKFSKRLFYPATNYVLRKASK